MSLTLGHQLSLKIRCAKVKSIQDDRELNVFQNLCVDLNNELVV